MGPSCVLMRGVMAAPGSDQLGYGTERMGHAKAWNSHEERGCDAPWNRRERNGEGNARNRNGHAVNWTVMGVMSYGSETICEGLDQLRYGDEETWAAKIRRGHGMNCSGDEAERLGVGTRWIGAAKA